MTAHQKKWDDKELKDLFTAIGLADPNGNNYRERAGKHKQIFDFIVHLNKAVEKLSTKRQLIFVDCACGKSYLSFVANYYFTHVKKRKIKIVGIDINPEVIASSKKAAEELGFTNMDFICDDIFAVDFPVKPDIVYSLHACDTATDMTLAKGILEEAKYIMTVSCCQHTMRRTMKKHLLGAVTKHGVYRERLSDMVADSMRTLLLESRGYKVGLFEYVAASETPKNFMIRASRIGTLSPKKYAVAMSAYNKLEDLFHTGPHLNHLLHEKSGVVPFYPGNMPAVNQAAKNASVVEESKKIMVNQV